MRYEVMADVKYLDGHLAGLTIPGGHRVTFPRRKIADAHARFLAKVRDTDDFMRACITGNRFKVIGKIDVNRIDPNR